MCLECRLEFTLCHHSPSHAIRIRNEAIANAERVGSCVHFAGSWHDHSHEAPFRVRNALAGVNIRFGRAGDHSGLTRKAQVLVSKVYSQLVKHAWEKSVHFVDETGVKIHVFNGVPSRLQVFFA